MISICILSLLVSLIFNTIQFNNIREYKQKQNHIDNEFKASVNELIHVINSTDFSKSDSERISLISSGTERTFTLVRLSSYRDDEKIYNCFEGLYNFFSKPSIDKIRKNGDQIKNLINKTFDKRNSLVFAEWEINSKDCKVLTEFLQQM